MGYDFHITRADPWWENDDRPIGPDQWLAIVEDDPELRLDPANGPYFALWLGDSELDDPWLDWEDGRIFTKNPDRALLDKMLEIARRLGANVLGDDGEPYLGGGQFGTDARGEGTLSRLVNSPSFPLALAIVCGLCLVLGIILDEQVRPAGRLKPDVPEAFPYLLFTLGMLGVVGWAFSSVLAAGALFFRHGTKYALSALIINAAIISYLMLGR